MQSIKEIYRIQQLYFIIREQKFYKDFKRKSVMQNETAISHKYFYPHSTTQLIINPIKNYVHRYKLFHQRSQIPLRIFDSVVTELIFSKKSMFIPPVFVYFVNGQPLRNLLLSNFIDVDIQINMLHALIEDFATWHSLTVLLAIFVVYQAYRVSNFKKRMEAVRSRPLLNIEPHKVIVALDLVDLFVQTSLFKRQNFQKLKLKATGISHTLLKVKEFFGIGLYFKPKMLKKNMRILLQSLADNPKIQLFLYTTLPLPAADDLLTNLCLAHFFPSEFRRSSREEYCQRLKHPTEVDQNTKRVIILTNTAQDYVLQDSKYFVQLKDSGEVVQAIKMLSQVINKNRSVEELHNELAQAKAELEYDI